MYRMPIIVCIECIVICVYTAYMCIYMNMCMHAIVRVIYTMYTYPYTLDEFLLIPYDIYKLILHTILYYTTLSHTTYTL